jgi:pyruvate dehydrogenase E2 component (dihydrolipoamide acetyltransferase)
MTEVIMPKMGDGMEEGTLLSWSKKEGDKVKAGEVIGEIQTDKAVMELEAPGKGTLGGFLIQEGETVPVGVPIAAILKDGETLPAGWGKGGAPVAAPAEEASAPAAAEAPAAAASAPAAPASSGRVKASPLARRIAADAGVEISAIEGSGPGGRIVEKDVRAAIAAQSSPAPAPAAPLAAASAADTKVPLNRLRGIIAQRTQASFRDVPHFYVTLEVDLEGIEAIRDAFKVDEAGRISINDFIVKACAMALQEMPIVNSSFGGDHLVQHGSVNVGVAVAIPDGLVVPVIRNANLLTLRQIAAASRDLAEKARANKLTPEEMSGGTFSISNMGMLNVDAFGAIINAPEAAIVAISSARRVPVITADNEIEVRTRMNITGSFDHRVVDGAIGAQFMNLIREALEKPTRLLS